MAVAALVCCTKNESDAPGGKDGTESVPVVSGQSSLTAVIHDEEATDKAAVADDGAVTWSKGDALSVYDGSGFTTFTLEGNGGSGTGTDKHGQNDQNMRSSRPFRKFCRYKACC